MVKTDENGKELKGFKIGELFDIGTGSYCPGIEKGNVPRISTKSTENGLLGYFSSDNYSGARHEENCITVNFFGSDGGVFYHKNRVSLDLKVHSLKPKGVELNRRLAMFLCSALKRPLSSYSYAKQLSSSKLKSDEIYVILPVNSDGSPDWDYMEDYIADIEHKYVDNVRKFNRHEMELLNKIYPDNEHPGEPYELKDFKVGEVVNFYKGRRVTKDKQIPGEIPYITAVSTNNGIDNFIENPVETKENMGTMSFFGDCFYHPYKFGIKDGTYAVEIKSESHRKKENYLYVLSALEKVGKTVGSYSKMLTDSIAKELLIKLPATINEEIDWHYIEQYMTYIGGGGETKSKDGATPKRADIVQVSQTVKYKEFRLDDLCEIKQTVKLKLESSNYIKDDEVISVNGKTPYVAAISNNNGIKGYSEYPPNNEGNVITLSTTADSSNTIFYQSQPFIGRQQIVGIRVPDDKLNKRIAKYLITFLKKQTSAFNYGRKLTVDHLKEMKIKLPVNNDESPDWEAVDFYIKTIELKEKENRRISQRKKELILERLANR